MKTKWTTSSHSQDGQGRQRKPSSMRSQTEGQGQSSTPRTSLRMTTLPHTEEQEKPVDDEDEDEPRPKGKKTGRRRGDKPKSKGRQAFALTMTSRQPVYPRCCQPVRVPPLDLLCPLSHFFLRLYPRSHCPASLWQAPAINTGGRRRPQSSGSTVGNPWNHGKNNRVQGQKFTFADGKAVSLRQIALTYDMAKSPK